MLINIILMVKLGSMSINNITNKIIINHNDTTIKNHLTSLFDLIYTYDYNNRITSKK